jgi:hypothetical protein
MDEAFRERVKQLAADYARQLAERDRQNPFGVEITEGGWAGNGRVVGDAITAYWLHKAFPKLIDSERVLTGLSYLFGTQDGVVLQIDLLSDLGDGLEVAPAGSPAVQFVDEGDRELLAVDLHNVTDRALVLDGVRVFVGGNGVSPSGVTGLYAVVVDGAGGELLVGGPMSLPAALEFDMPLQQVLLPAQSTTRLSLRAELHAPLDGSTLEVAAAVVSADAWQLRALGAGVGPDVRVVGTGRAEGPIILLGRLPGDIYGSAERDVVDLRRVIAAVGCRRWTDGW